MHSKAGLFYLTSLDLVLSSIAICDKQQNTGINMDEQQRQGLLLLLVMLLQRSLRRRRALLLAPTTTTVNLRYRPPIAYEQAT